MLAWYNQSERFKLATAIEYPVDIGAVELQYHFACLDPNRRLLGICEAAGHSPVGVIDLVVGEPDDESATIGLFMVAAERQRAGIGKEAVRTLEASLAEEATHRLRVGVLSGNAPALRFWRSLGYEVGDGSGRRLMIAGQEHDVIWLQKALA